VASIQNGAVTLLRTPARKLTPRLWASWKPFGIGERRPNNYLEIVLSLIHI